MSKQEILKSVAQPHIKEDVPDIRPGDTVKAHVRVVEGGKERIQIFEGVTIAIKNGGISKNITLRKVSNGVGVERTLPLHSPRVAKFEVVRHAVVRRAKLYYLRDRSGKAARLKERRVFTK